MQSLSNAITTFLNGQIVPLGITAGVAALVIVGFALVIGTRQMIDWAKNHIFHILLGLALIYLASNIVTGYVSSLGGAGF